MQFPYFWDITARLKNEFPLELPVHIRTFDDLRHHGTASIHGKGKSKHFVIKIRRDDETTMVHVMLEEYAHCLTWFSKDTHDHGECWARRYAKLRKWYEEIQ